MVFFLPSILPSFLPSFLAVLSLLIPDNFGGLPFFLPSSLPPFLPSLSVALTLNQQPVALRLRLTELPIQR